MLFGCVVGIGAILESGREKFDQCNCIHAVKNWDEEGMRGGCWADIFLEQYCVGLKEFMGVWVKSQSCINGGVTACGDMINETLDDEKSDCCHNKAWL